MNFPIALFDIMVDFFEPARNLFWPPNVGNVLLLIIIIGGLTALIFRIAHSREPAQKRIDEYIFNMPNEYFRAMMYHYPEPTDDHNLELLKSLPEAINVADIMLRSKDELYFYVGRIQKMQDATIEEGTIILMTHTQLDDRDSYFDAGSHTDIFRGPIHLRRAREALPQARFYHNAGEWDNSPCHLVYYPTPPSDHYMQPKIITSDKELLGVSALLKQTITHVKIIKDLESARKAAETKLQDCQRQLTSMTFERNEGFTLLAQKRFDTQSLLQSRPAMSQWLAGAIIFFAIFGTIQFMQSQYPSTPITTQMFIGAIVGFSGIMLAGHFMGSRSGTTTTTTPITG